MQSSVLLATGSSPAGARCIHKAFRSCSNKRPFTSALHAEKGNKDLLSNITDDLKGEEVKADPPAKKGFGTPQPEAKKKQKSKPKQGGQSKPFQLQPPPEQTPAQNLEANVVRFLALLFVIFFCEGIFLAVAGFLPEAADDFAMAYVYPAFSPTLGLFLLISVIYGLVKTRQGGA